MNICTICGTKIRKSSDISDVYSSVCIDCDCVCRAFPNFRAMQDQYHKYRFRWAKCDVI